MYLPKVYEKFSNQFTEVFKDYKEIAFLPERNVRITILVGVLIKCIGVTIFFHR